MSSPSSTALPDLLAHLQHLTTGLLYQSESDAPLQVVNCAKPMDSLSQETLLTLLGEPADAPVHVVPLAYFLRHHTAARQDANRQAMAKHYQALQAFMEQYLPKVRVYRVGSEPRLHAYALGETDSGQLVGFKTVLIET